MQTVVLILICVIVALVAFGGFYIAAVEAKQRREYERLYKEAQTNADKAAEIITEANGTKEAANTGDINNDLDYMANKLHEYATK